METREFQWKPEDKQKIKSCKFGKLKIRLIMLPFSNLIDWAVITSQLDDEVDKVRPSCTHYT